MQASSDGKPLLSQTLLLCTILGVCLVQPVAMPTTEAVV